MEEPLNLGLLLLRNQAVLPGSRARLDVARPKSVALLQHLRPEAEAGARPLIVLAVQRDPTTENHPPVEALPRHGVLARILSGEEGSHGKVFLEVEAIERVRIGGVVSENPFLLIRAEPMPAPADLAPEAKSALSRMSEQAARVLQGIPSGLGSQVASGAEAVEVADRIASRLPAAPADKARLVETESLEERIRELERLLAVEEERWSGLREAEVRETTTMAPLEQPWALQSRATARIEADLRSGTLSRAEAADLAHFAEKGYVIWSRLIPDRDVDALLGDLTRIHEHPGRFITTDHRRGRPFRYSGPDPDRFESIFDTYVNFESARNIAFHPRVLRFLEILFDARPIAFQQLLFQRSNAHQVHQDTAYVCVREPLLLAATWVALEDVVPGRGELTYYEGSHLIPGIRYADGSKRFMPGIDDEDDARARILEQCRERGCAKRDFIAKKGDVFLWAADLVHGSNPRTRPIEETRLSCVTHYCPETTIPAWFLLSPAHRGLQPCGDRASLASAHYVLPTESGMARPSLDQPLPG